MKGKLNQASNYVKQKAEEKHLKEKLVGTGEKIKEGSKKLGGAISAKASVAAVIIKEKSDKFKVREHYLYIEK